MSIHSALQYYDATVAEYHTTRAWYIRTIMVAVEQRVMETIGKRRASLKQEITNLALLANDRYDAYRTALESYSEKAPSRVTTYELLPPSLPQRMIRGIDELYKAAVEATAAFSECTAVFKKRKEQLAQIDQKMRVQVEQHGRDILAQLETPTGLEGAFMRDPLLRRTHARMLDAQARRRTQRRESSKR